MIRRALSVLAGSLLSARPAPRWPSWAWQDTAGWRSQYGDCSECGAAEPKWCLPGCSLIDPGDYR